MAFTGVLAQATVKDLDQAVEWYGRVFGREPDNRPMDGLIEWHFAESFGVQVFAEPDRAGNSSIILTESDLDDFIARLDAAGVSHGEPHDVTSSRILALEDPDGNRIVVSGAPST